MDDAFGVTGSTLEEPSRCSSSWRHHWPSSVILTKKYLDFAHFTGEMTLDLCNYDRENRVFLMKEVSCGPITSTVTDLISISSCFHASNLEEHACAG